VARQTLAVPVQQVDLPRLNLSQATLADIKPDDFAPWSAKESAVGNPT
jgi:hypothetical protein